MRLLLHSLIAVGASLGLAACGCTEVGCDPSTSVQIDADGWPAGAYTVTVEAGGRSLTCTAAHDPATVGTCGDYGEVFFTVGTAEAPAEVVVFGAPETLRVVLERGEATLLDETVEPDVDDFRPNGAFCGPVCEAGHAALRID